MAASAALKDMENVKLNGCAEVAPTREQIDALRNRKKMYVVVNYRGLSKQGQPNDQIPIEEASDEQPGTTVGQLIELICARNELEQTSKYGIVEIADFGAERSLEKEEVVLQVMESWQRPQAQGRFGLRKRVVHYRLFFQRRITLSQSDASEDVATMPDGDMHMLFTQTKFSIISGYYLCTDTEALLLAALVMQIEHGNYDPEKHRAGFLRDYIDQYIPAHLRKLQKTEVWESDLIKTHSRMRGFTADSSKQNYIRCAYVVVSAAVEFRTAAGLPHVTRILTVEGPWNRTRITTCFPPLCAGTSSARTATRSSPCSRGTSRSSPRACSPVPRLGCRPPLPFPPPSLPLPSPAAAAAAAAAAEAPTMAWAGCARYSSFIRAHDIHAAVNHGTRSDTCSRRTEVMTRNNLYPGTRVLYKGPGTRVRRRHVSRMTHASGCVRA